MGYARYVLPDGREAGYDIIATCDRAGCEIQIDRGLDYLCGEMPNGFRDAEEPGCGGYFCSRHGLLGAGGDHDCPNPPRDLEDDSDYEEASGATR